MNMNEEVGPELLPYRHNKKIPAAIEKNVLKALSYYPELKDARINFNFKTNIKTSVMQAQPVFSTLLMSRAKRRYRINISTHFKLIHCDMSITKIPDEVMIGWIGHELGHILDYEQRSNTGIISFGYRYVFSTAFVKEAERVADTYAVERGLGKYIIATKRFILDHAELSHSYKDKITRLYLSPDVIVELVKKLEAKEVAKQAKA
jgi:hypothetical protein